MNYRKVDQSVCQLDLQHSSSRLLTERRRRRRGGTLAPLLTVSVLVVLSLCAAVYWVFKQQITKLIARFLPPNKPLPKQPSISELEMMEVDPFKTQFQSIEKFSVHEKNNYHQ